MRPSPECGGTVVTTLALLPKLADTLEGLLGRLADGPDQLSLDRQQRIRRLIVSEVLIGEDDDKVTIRHWIPTPQPAATQVTFCVGAVTTPPCAAGGIRAEADDAGDRRSSSLIDATPIQPP